jgi:hypothetical protein
MLKKILMVFMILATGNVAAQQVETDFPLTFRVRITNPLNVARENTLVVLSPEQIRKVAAKFNDKAFVVVDAGKEIPSQYNLHDTDDPGLVFVLDKLMPSESREVIVRYKATGTMTRNYAKRTQAELSHKTGGEWKGREYMAGAFHNVEYLRVPPEHKDHSWFIRYEGPGWESDKVGYRFYLDQRNATDVFGKKVPELVLQNVGLDGFDSYHNLQPWGMDVMKVGKSLGIGSLGASVDGKTMRVEKTDSVNCRIVENGAVFSSIATNYSGWLIGAQKHDVRSRISIHAGTRLTRQQFDITNPPENLVTGIVKDINAKLFTQTGSAQQWAYLATYGKQSLNSDELGLAVLVKPSTLTAFSGDEFSHIMQLRSGQGKLEYYFLAAWVGEPGGVADERQFLDYVNQVAKELANPVTVVLMAGKK